MSSHKQILKSSGIVGGAQVINIIIGIIRSKVIAVLLGPAGVGFAGMLTATTSIIGSITGLGIGSSAVRNIAEASGSGDERRIAKTIKILRRLVWGTGLLGMGITVLFCHRLSRMTFNSPDHALEIALLSVTLFLGAISAGQTALLQGLRRIRQMALAGIIGSSLGLVTTLPLYWWLGIRGIVPALIVASLTTLGLSWWFARQVQTVPVEASLQETAMEGWSMVKLGVCMTAASLMGTGVMYLVRVVITNRLDLNAVGIFQAAWGISSTYLGMVLGAMGADYYPRLTMVTHDNQEMNRLANEQTQMALLFSGPLIVAMITFMPLVVWGLYSQKFNDAIGILRWQLSGDLIKVFTWPIGFILLAKGAGRMYVLSELCWDVAYYAIILLLWNKFGLNSVGISFLFSYFVYFIFIVILAKILIGFSWTPQVIRLIYVYMFFVIISALNAYFLVAPWNYVIGSVFCVVIIFHSLREIINLLGDNEGLSSFISHLRSKFPHKTKILERYLYENKYPD